MTTKKEKIWIYFKKALVKTTLSMSLLTFLFFTAVFIALLSPFIQTYIAHKTTKLITEELNFPVEIKSIEISWLDEIILNQLIIKDKEGTHMIEIKKTVVDYNIFSIFSNNTIDVEKVILNEASVVLINDKKDNTLNINEFIDALTQKLASNKSSGKSPGFAIRKVEVQNSRFESIDERYADQIEGFDHWHFGFDSVFATVTDFKIAADTFQINVNKLKCKELKTKLRVKEVNSTMRLTSHTMEFGKISAKIGNSYFRDSISFKFNSFLDFGDNYFDNVTMYMNLDSSSVSSKDLSYFAPYLSRYKDRWNLKGIAKGTVKNFDIKKMQLDYGKHSHIEGYISFNGLPDFFETFIEAKLKKTHVEAEDMAQYFSEIKSFEIFKRFEKLNANGNFVGFPKDFVAQGKFETSIGNFTSDLNLKIHDKEENSYYKGSLTTTELHLGKLANLSNLGVINMKGNLEGTGFSLNNAHLKLDATIDKIGLNHYNYKNIVTKAKFANEFFDGYLSISDSNLTGTLNGEVDFRNHKDSIGLAGNISKFNFKKLGFTDFELSVTSDFDIKLKGLELEKMVGTSTFNDLSIKYKNKSLTIDSLDLFSHKYLNKRSFILNSNLLYFTALGDFEFKEIISDAQMFLDEYKLYFLHNDLKTARYYEKKKGQNHNEYKLTYHMLVKNINPLLQVIAPDWYFSKNTYLKGTLSNGEYSEFAVEGKISSFGYKKYAFVDSDLDFYTSKGADNTNVEARMKFNAKKQLYENEPITKNIGFSSKWLNDNIEFNSSLSHYKYESEANVDGTLSFLHNEMQLYLQRLDLNALDQFWQLKKEKLVIFKGDDIYFDSLCLVNNDQKINLFGTLSKDPESILNFEANNFNLQTLYTLFQTKINGVADGLLSVKNIYQNPAIQGNLDITKLIIENIEIGDVNTWAGWNNERKKIEINGSLRKNNMPVVSVYGDFDPYNEISPLNLKADLNHTSLKILETFLSEYASEFIGDATGSFKISGKLKKPVIQGSAYVHQGGFKINYLNTFYNFSESVYLNENKIYVQNAKVYDIDKNLILLNGGLEHKYFNNFKINLKGEMKNAMVFNIPFSKDALYYGTGIADGDFNINGGFDQVHISGDLITKTGTKVYIPLTWLNYLSQKDYIKYTNQKLIQEEKALLNKPKVNLSGIKLDINLEINPDALTEIIFDDRTGDIIKGRGNGKLLMNIDTKGDFEMFGDYRFTEGDYHFTFLNIINKEFKIKKGSNIHFAGPVYEGQLDVQVANELSIPYLNIGGSSLTKTDSSLLSVANKVLVNLFLKGELTKPLVTTGIELKNPPNLDPLLLDFKNKIASNEQELNRQVFSLLVFRSFAPDQNLFTASNAGNATGRTLTELLSNQLNNWISQVDPNFQVEVSANNLNTEQLNFIRLGLYYQLNKRTRLTRDGSIANAQNQTSATTLIGEIAIEYSLNQSGSIKIKAYTKPNQASLVGGSTNVSSAQQGGVSILHSKSFESFANLFSKKKKDSIQ